MIYFKFLSIFEINTSFISTLIKIRWIKKFKFKNAFPRGSSGILEATRQVKYTQSLVFEVGSR